MAPKKGRETPGKSVPLEFPPYRRKVEVPRRSKAPVGPKREKVPV
jgi:hypothetical protein